MYRGGRGVSGGLRGTGAGTFFFHFFQHYISPSGTSAMGTGMGERNNSLGNV